MLKLLASDIQAVTLKDLEIDFQFQSPAASLVQGVVGQVPHGEVHVHLVGRFLGAPNTSTEYVSVAPCFRGAYASVPATHKGFASYLYNLRERYAEMQKRASPSLQSCITGGD